MTYLQTLYISSLAEIANKGLGQLLSRQDEAHKLIQNIRQKLSK
jgi:hypothetical protein